MKYLWALTGFTILLLGAVAMPAIGPVSHHVTTLIASGVIPGGVTSPGVI